MIKFSGEGLGGRQLFGLGLSRGNIDRLTSDQPIVVNLDDMGGPKIQIVIVFGETERSLFEELQAIGAIPKDVEYKEVKSGETQVVRFKRS